MARPPAKIAVRPIAIRRPRPASQSSAYGGLILGLEAGSVSGIEGLDIDCTDPFPAVA